jgi:hypothetical protein
MGTFQYYEFQAIDRALTEEEQQAVAQLSSRVHPHPWRAVFIYHWADFPGDAEEILARYYDAMVYHASWGGRQLMFRFPRSVLDLEGAAVYRQPLIVQDYVGLSLKGPYAVLDIKFVDEERGGLVTGDDVLAVMLSLRDDLIHGDYRALYLAWLKVLQVEDLLDSVSEPPVPPGLNPLPAALRAFVEFFEIDETLLRVAAEASGSQASLPEGWLPRALSQLAEAERDAFLLRLATGEAHLSAELNRRLRRVSPLLEPEAGSRRTVGELLRLAEDRRAHQRRLRAEKAEAQRIQQLEALAPREAEIWTEVDRLIERMDGRAYDEAVALLIRLRDLAEYQGEGSAFQARLNRIYAEYPRRSGLLRRLREGGLQQR